MKKLLSLLCASVLAISVMGCSNQPVSNPESAAQNNGGKQSEQPASAVNLTGDIGGEIRVSVYDFLYKEFLDEAAAAFELKYPGTKVNVDTISVMPEVKTSENGNQMLSIVTIEDDPAAKSDYINKISTELMSGKGADILAMDVLPFYRYADNGQLENLQPYIDADTSFNVNDYRNNIWDATKYNNGQYLMPVDYSFNYFAYDSSLFSEEDQKPLQSSDTFTYKELIALGEKPYQTYNNSSDTPAKLLGLNDQRMFSEMIREDYNSYINMDTKDVNFNDGKFADLLNSVKEYADKGYLNPTVPRGEALDMDAMQKMRDEKNFFKSMNARMLLQHFNKNSGRMMYYSGMSNTNNDELAGLPANQNGEIPFTFSQAYGMNPNSQNKETAWEFLKFLLGDEMQMSFNLRGLAVNNNVRAENAKSDIAMQLNVPGQAFKQDPQDNAPSGDSAPEDQTSTPPEEQLSEAPEGKMRTAENPQGGHGGQGPQGGSIKKGTMMAPQRDPNAGPVILDEEQQAIFDEYWAAVEKYSSMLNTCVITDSTINTIIEAEIAPFFEGTKTAQEVADVLQNKISLYVNE